MSLLSKVSSLTGQTIFVEQVRSNFDLIKQKSSSIGRSSLVAALTEIVVRFEMFDLLEDLIVLAEQNRSMGPLLDEMLSWKLAPCLSSIIHHWLSRKLVEIDLFDELLFSKVRFSVNQTSRLFVRR